MSEHVAPEVATGLVRDGALLASDPCGCGGTCGLETLDGDTSAGLARAGQPSVSTDPRHPGSLSQWIGTDGSPETLVLAAGQVIWGRALA